jgi:iron(III) transport system ATP-binding protein
MPKLELRGLAKSYGAVKVVDDVNLSIAEGEFVSLLGPSGCGKTTTLRMIAGFVPPSEGSILMDGKLLSSPKASTPPERRNMSMIFQSYAIWPNMTVAENVGFGLKLRKLSREEIRHRTNEILEVTRMGHLAGRYPAELSGGQQQRVALARAIVVKPSVLLLDEPLSNLDANLREEMRVEIRRLHDEFRITTVYVTHDQGEAMATSDRIAVMNAGRIEQIDNPYDLYNSPRTQFVAGFIGRSNFLPAKSTASKFDFGGFTIDQKYLPEIFSNSEILNFVVRPQNLRIHGVAPPNEQTDLVIEAVVEERTYLGEHWDYAVRPQGGGSCIRVATLPAELHTVGSRVWLEIDPKHIVAL